MEEELVSIIIPVFNREKTIGESIKSILEQTYSNFELIIVDDHSNDNSIKVAKSLNDPRIKIISHKVNKGACAARNTGIENASGKYIAFNDSDDLWRKEKLEKQILTIKESGADVVFCQMYRHNYKTQEILFPNLEEGFVDFKDLLIRSKCSTQTICAKREVFRDFLFDESIPRMQDYDFVIRSAQKFSYYFQKECLVDVYLQSDSITSNNHKKLYEICEILYNKHKNLFNEYPEFEAFLLDSLGYFQTEFGIPSFYTYRRMFEIDKNFKNFIKMIFSRVGILKYIWFK